jgi:hypothetical protein
MGQRHTSMGALLSRRTYRPESSIKQVGYLLILAAVSAAVMVVGLGLLDVILDSVQT